MFLIVPNRHATARGHPWLIAMTLAIVVSAAFVVPWTAPSVAAHAGFAESDPEPNSIVAEAPETVTIRFTEPLERSYSTAELHDQSGEVVSGTTVREGADEFEMVLDLPSALPNGTYSVLWRTLSTADGHTTQNYFAFTIGGEADVAVVDGPSVESGDSSAPLWLQTLSRWTAYLGLAAAVAAWPLWLLVIRPGVGSARAAAGPLVRRMQWFALAAIALALVGNVFAIAVQASSLPDGTLLERIRSTLGDTRYGELWYLRVALLLAYGIVLQWMAWWWPKRRIVLSIGALMLAFALVIPFSYIAHASAQTTGRGAAILNDGLHLLAASLWAGGLMILLLVLLPGLRRLQGDARRIALSRVLSRYSTLALIAWITMSLTGLYSAWLQVGSFEGLLETDYGNTLLAKLLLLIPILALAAFNLLVFTSRLEHLAGHLDQVATWTRRFVVAVGSEVVLAVVVLLVVGSLTAQAPARESMDTGSDPVEVALSGSERDANLTLDPGAPGPNRFEIAIDGDPLPHEADVLLRVSSADQDTGQKELAFAHGDTNRYSYEGSELSLAGEWDFELIVRPPDAFEWRGYGSATIESASGSTGASQPSWVLSSVGGTIGVLVGLLGVGALVTGLRSSTARLRTSLVATGAGALVVAVIVVAGSRTELTAMAAGALARLI